MDDPVSPKSQHYTRDTLIALNLVQRYSFAASFAVAGRLRMILRLREVQGHWSRIFSIQAICTVELSIKGKLFLYVEAWFQKSRSMHTKRPR